MPEIQSSLGDNAAYTLLMESQIASALRDQQRYGEAEKAFSSSCPQLAHQLGADNKDAVACLQNQAELYADMQHWSQAAALLQQVDASYSKVDGCDQTSTCIDTESDYALAIANDGQAKEALVRARAAVDRALKASGLNETTLPHVLYVFGTVALLAGHIDDANRAAAQLQQALRRQQEQASLWSGQQLLLNAKLKLATGDPAGARADAVSAIEHLRERPTRTIIDSNEATNLLRRLPAAQ